MKAKEFLIQDLSFPLFQESTTEFSCCGKKKSCCKSYKKKGKHCKKCPKL